MRLGRTLGEVLRHPIDFLETHILGDWAQRSTILLVMQNVDNRVKMRLGRSIFTLFRRNLVSQPENEFARRIPSKLPVAHQVTKTMAARIGAVPAGPINEGLLNTTMTAKIMGDCPFREEAEHGAIVQAAGRVHFADHGADFDWRSCQVACSPGNIGRIDAYRGKLVLQRFMAELIYLG